ncbi:MAG TPA: ATP-dependent DNA helicase RecG [Candidatus Dojkabacteria bacterium]|nr:ATP-dependent DNA helicase RecG [Candidatus Dojkabacteria bacterium]HOT61118.1 ATP-dependent DNA helicase RecG [Candidatus Dojkabacteria bacterium]HQI92892.1 ATP-dependent DNA helicase RecG [Candidatus Dojkabacteria bacterium]
MSLTADSKVVEIKGVGESLATKFSRLNITTVRDLLFHVPIKYQDSSHLLSIEDFLLKGEGTFLAEIVDVKTFRTRTGKTITTVKVKDDTKKINLTYFNQPYLSKVLIKNETYLFDGKVTIKGSKRDIYNPKYELFKGEKEKQTNLGKLAPIYPETEGLTSNMIRKILKTVKEDIPKILSDPLAKYTNISLQEAITKIHFPKDTNDILQARERLAFDEMLKIAIKIETEILERSTQKTLPIKTDTKILNKFIKSLPYKLTNDQNKAMEIILEEINREVPMNRLLNGDVGSGKTVVAASAVLNTIKNGFSCVLLAPTTVLAKQHYDTFKDLFKGFHIPIELCISSQQDISDANNKLIIATHSILYDKQLPSDLNLVIIDEQHRFGVEQRKYFLKKLPHTPHHLTMTATPIPRSLTEIFFGNLDVSEIREKPSNRRGIKSFYTPFTKRDDCFNWVAKKIKESQFKEQAFVIYPLIEETDISVAKTVLTSFEELKKKYFKDISITYLHGRMKDTEKTKILNDFKKKKYNVLVSTSVIEVGIDIPDATIMVIENAERFGLAQLHQLRGRVGRSDLQSYCYTIPGIEVEKDSKAEERLKYFSKHSSGFDVAEYDLQSRGPGEVYGIAQSGIPLFKVASIHDLDTLKKARNVAKRLLKSDNHIENILQNIFR